MKLLVHSSKLFISEFSNFSIKHLRSWNVHILEPTNWTHAICTASASINHFQVTKNEFLKSKQISEQDKLKMKKGILIKLLEL